MNDPGDTIAAIATAPGEAAIAIVRVSGPDSLQIADRILDCRPPKPSARDGYTFLRGYVRGDETGAERIDEVITLIYRAPHSYTTEDTIEIQGHGGRAQAARILRAEMRPRSARVPVARDQ